MSGAASSKALFRATKPKPRADARQISAADAWHDQERPRGADIRDPLDYDPTPEDATSAFLAAEGDRLRQIGGPIWEPAVGGGHMARVMERHGFEVIGSDVVDRGHPGTIVRSFYEWRRKPARILITNPPYGEVSARDGHGRWLRHALSLKPTYIAFLLNWDWIAARINGMDELHAKHPVSRAYVCTWKIDFRGLGSPPQRNGWLVWDRRWRRQYTALRRLFREAGDAQEAGVLIWASCSQNPASTPVALWSGRTTLGKPSSPHSGPDTSPPLQSGTMSQPSTPGLSPEISTPSSPAIPASHSARQASEREKTTSGTCGPTSSGSSDNSAPRSDGASSRTCRDTSPSALRPCCEAYATWVSRLRLAYSRRKKSARRMKGSGSSSWPTANAGPQNDTDTNWPERRRIAQEKHGNNGFGLTLGMAVSAWPTPMAGTPAQNGNNAAGNNDFTQKAEELALAMWTTPQAHDVTARGAGQKPTAKAGNACLATDAQNWPTATARDHKGSSETSLTRKDGKSRLDMLDFAAEQGFSHPAPPTSLPGLPSSEWRPISRRLFRSAMSNVPPTTLRRWLRRGDWRKRRLNPLFVEWLMGWPPGHALCGCSETAWSQWQRHMRGALSALPTASGAWIWEPPAVTEDQTQMDLF